MSCFLNRPAMIGCTLAMVAAFGAGASLDLRLIQAAKAQDEAATRSLLNQHTDVNAQQGDGSTALHFAAYFDNLTIADLLIRAGARVNTPNDLGSTPLHLACNNGSAAMAERLLAAKANPNAKLLDGQTVLMTCARTGSARAVKALLVAGADAKASEPEHNETALMWAAAESHPDVVAMLIEFGADVRARSRSYPQTVVGEQTQRAGREELNYTVMKGGSTPLLFAARSDAESAKRLLAAGADPNDSLSDGTSALVLAAHSGQRDVALALLDKGANPNNLGSGYSALHAAVLRSDLNLVKTLLAHGADPNIRMTKGTPVRRNSTDYFLLAPLVGSTPYLLAAKFLESEIMHALLAGGADPKLTMPDGATALMLAAGIDSPTNEDRRGVNVIDFGKLEPESKVLPAVMAAFEAGGGVNAANNMGDTALHAAVTHRYENVIQFLADRGADVNARNKKGLTPLGVLNARRIGGEKPTASTVAGAAASGGAITDEPVSQRIAALLYRLGAAD
ncbi:MAG TPA: ankyrin repeat domain-containing protein [Bryobacteraceae bacterium]|nr:ankyrin repeat domain-containing protein [Bryobacteraceae bacterium]